MVSPKVCIPDFSVPEAGTQHCGAGNLIIAMTFHTQDSYVNAIFGH